MSDNWIAPETLEEAQQTAAAARARRDYETAALALTSVSGLFLKTVDPTGLNATSRDLKLAELTIAQAQVCATLHQAQQIAAQTEQLQWIVDNKAFVTIFGGNA